MARIAGVDLPREKRVEIGLTYVYGIGRNSAMKILEATGINPDTRVKDLTEEQLQENDLLELDLSIFEIQKYKPIQYNLTILYEDEYIIVVNKPSGFIVYDVEDEKESICTFLRYYYKQYKKNFEIIPVHRLDIDTSGCLIFAKDVVSASGLSRSFEKNY